MIKYKKPELKRPSRCLYQRLLFPLPVLLALAMTLLTPVSYGSDTQPPNEIKILIADFADSTGDPDLATLIKPILHQTLQQSDRLSVYPEMKALRFLRDNFTESNDGMTLSRARQLCLSENIPVILLPGISNLEGSLIISAKLIYLEEDRELFVDTLRVISLDQLAITIENLSKRIRQSLGEKWGSPAMTGDIFSTDTTFRILQILSRSLSFDSYVSRRDAIERLEHILEQDPDMALAQLQLGKLYLQLQQPRKALIYISKARDNSKNLPLKCRYLIDGLNDFLNYRYRDATDRFRSFADAFPYDWQAFFLLGRCEAVVGNYSAAAEENQKAVALDDTRIEPRIGMALALLYNGNSIAARRTLEDALRLVPNDQDDPEITIALGMVELVENNTRYAIQAFEQAGQRPLFRSLSTMLLAQTDIYSGKFDNALKLLTAGIEEDRKSRDVFAEASKRLARAQIYRLTGNTPATVAECLSMPDISDEPFLLAEKGSVFAGTGRPAEAEEIRLQLRSIQASPFIQALADRLQGEIHLAEDRLPQAQQSLQRAKEFNGAPSASLARVFMKTEQFEQAAGEFAAIRDQKAAVLFPYHRPWFAGNWVQALYDAGQCSRLANNPEQARQYFRQYLWVMGFADPSFETPLRAEGLLTE